MLTSYNCYILISALISDNRDHTQCGRRLPGRSGQPPHPARNTLRLTQAPIPSHIQYQEQDKGYNSSSDHGREYLHVISPYADSVGYKSEHPSLLGNSSSLFSINSPDSPNSPPLQKLNYFQFGAGQGTEKSPFAFTSSTPEQNLPFQLSSAKSTAPVQSSRNSIFSEQKPLAFEFGAGRGTSSSPFLFESPPSAAMVVEREPPKAVPQNPALASSFKETNRPEFGKLSPMQSRLQPINNVFNIPKHNQPRPEHHRPGPAPESHLQPMKDLAHKVIDTFNPHRPAQPTRRHIPGEAFVIAEPMNPPVFNTYPSTAPTFSAVNRAAAPYNAPFNSNFHNPIDLTNSDPALHDDRFGAEDPFLYIDPNKANENIKALLEGALEDEEDKPMTRRRKKKVETAVEKLSDKLNHLGVKSEEKKEEEESEIEDEDADDGSVEGLKVKLLPHQVEGVEWMREKEAGVRKKNAVLPKGGILADDMGQHTYSLI